VCVRKYLVLGVSQLRQELPDTFLPLASNLMYLQSNGKFKTPFPCMLYRSVLCYIRNCDSQLSCFGAGATRLEKQPSKLQQAASPNKGVGSRHRPSLRLLKCARIFGERVNFLVNKQSYKKQQSRSSAHLFHHELLKVAFIFSVP
jgi:hypothetical protein